MSAPLDVWPVPRMVDSKARRRVVILGAGSAGLGAALALKKASARHADIIEVTLVDQKNYHSVLPMVYQVVTGSVAPPHISFPVRKLLGTPGGRTTVAFVQSKVERIDVHRKAVVTDHGELRWDFLVVALGSTTNFFGMSDVEKTALPFRSLRDATDIHNRILDVFEAALLEEDEQRRRELLTLVVVGGGPTGAELTAHIQEYASRVLSKSYPSLTPLATVVLMEATDSLLPGMRAGTRERMASRLGSLGVKILLQTRVSGAGPNGIRTAAGDTIPTRTIVWAAGIKPVVALESIPCEKAKDGRIVVNQYLQVPGEPSVYAIGDCAYLEEGNSGKPYPPTFQTAYRQGPACARNVLRAIQGKPQRPFRPSFRGQIFYVNRNTAVAELFGLIFDGLAAGMVRRGLFIGMLIIYGGPLTGLKTKLGAALDWTFAYFYNRNTSRLE